LEKEVHVAEEKHREEIDRSDYPSSSGGEGGDWTLLPRTLGSTIKEKRWPMITPTCTWQHLIGGGRMYS